MHLALKENYHKSMLIVIILTILSTFTGGLFALRYQDKMHRILGFSAGVILGVVAFDILPEVFELSQQHGVEVILPMIALVAGFLTFHAVEKIVIIHGAHEDKYDKHYHPRLGVISALALAGHSLADGLAIGMAFRLNTVVGYAIALAVIAHDFADGLNTVSLMLAHKNDKKTTLRYLLINAITPAVGIVIALILPIPLVGLILFLGFFAGFLLYICASDILPEAHSRHPSVLTLLLTIFGSVFIFIVTRTLSF